MEMWAIATFSLVAGMVDDLRSRKVHNGLVLFLLPITLAGNFYFRGFEGMEIGFTALLLALLITIPLFHFGVLGGGDVKLFAVFALCVDPSCTLGTLVYSVIWGAFFGVTRAALQKQLMSLVRSTYRMATRQNVRPMEIHKIPYTFSLLLGWFTQLTLMRVGGLL